MTASSPIAVFVFNRPHCTEQVLEAVRIVRPAQLFIIADGPRPSHPNDQAACASVRRIADAAVDWRCDVRRDYADVNLGCARRVSSGLDWVFSQTDEAVILEDDCIPTERFFSFCTELLQRYRDEPRVGVIAGCNFQSHDVTRGNGYYFSRYPHCWGWATWRRAWKAYDHTMRDWPEVRQSGWLRSQCASRRETDYWQRIFDRVYAGEIDSWAYRWTYACWRSGFLAALPAANLVANIGFGAAATHTHQVPKVRLRAADQQPWPLVHPPRIERDATADRYTYRHHFDPTIWVRVRRKFSL